MGINDMPPDYDFGQDFNYAQWGANTTLRFANVPWNSDYRDVVSFADQRALDTYLSNQNGPVYTNTSYAKAYEPVRVSLPFNAVYQWNYLQVTNPAQSGIPGDVGRTFYYFIEDVRYIAPMTTEVILSLDIWQTFIRNVELGNCYIERGHIGIANVNSQQNRGRDYLTTPEGLDIGGEYVIRGVWDHVIGDIIGNESPESVGVLIASSVDLAASGGNFVEPVLKTARGSDFEGLPNGMSLYYLPNINSLSTLMGALQNTPWVSQGIVSITAIPQLKDKDGVTLSLVSGPNIPPDQVYSVSGRLPRSVVFLKENFRDGINTGRYARLHKFKTFPYSMVELTTYSGTPLVLRPELMDGTGIAAIELLHLAPPHQRVSYYPYRYNVDPANEPSFDSRGVLNDMGEHLDMQTGLMNLPTFSIVNNSYLSYMASNSNSIAYQYNSADWSQQKAIQAAGNSYSMGQAAISNTQAQNDISLRANAANTQNNNSTAGWNALQGGANALINGAAGGPMGLAAGALGAANAAAGYGIQVNHSNQALAISSQQMNDSTAGNVGLAKLGNETNYQMANYAARGDYANAIAGISAKTQDARMIQPTTAGQLGGDAFNLSVMGWRLTAKLKTIDNAARAVIGEFWLRYGYAINRFGKVPANFMVMQNFTYWKLQETYLRSSNCPELYKQGIRGIFEKGVTVWRNPDDIGMIDIANNAPLTGITL